jgi:hypothetical protein
MPSTSPILVSRVTRTTISVGGTICANWGFTSICDKLGTKIDDLGPGFTEVAQDLDNDAFHDRMLDIRKFTGQLGAFSGTTEQTVDYGKGHRRINLEDYLAFEGIHADHSQSGGSRNGSDELFVGKLVHRSYMHIDQDAQGGRQTGGGQTRKGLMHVLHCPHLFLGELVRPAEVVDLDLPGVGGRLDSLKGGIPCVYGGEELIYFVLGQDFGHNGSPPRIL